MKTSKIFKLFNLMASILILTVLLACNMQASQLIEEKNNSQTGDLEKTQYVKISFELKESDESIDNLNFSRARTILPADLDISSYTFILAGVIDDESSSFDGAEDSDFQWDSYSSFQSASLTLKPGTWNFTLTIKNTSGNLYATSQLEDVELTVEDSSKTLTFTDLTYPDSEENTRFEVTVYVLSGLLKDGTGPVLSVEGIGVSNQAINYTTSPEGEKTVDGKIYEVYFYKADNSFNQGLYKLTFTFDTDSSDTTSRVLFVYLAAGRKSVGEVYFDDLNKEYSIQINLNDGLDNSIYSSDKFSISGFTSTYLVSQDVTLPEPTYSNSTGEAVTFGGWYTSTDFSEDNKIEGWEAGTMSDNISLYARWYVPIEYLDYGKAYYSGQPYDADSNNDDLPLEYTINSTSAITIPEATSIYDSDSTYKKEGAENSVTFIDWTDSEGNTILSNSSYILTSGQNPTAPITLRAKWGYEYVYVDPSAEEDGCGLIPSEPKKSFSDALKILTIQDSSKESSYGKGVYVMSEIPLSSDVSELSDEDICNYLIQIYRYKNYLDGPLFRINGEVTFPAIYIRGESKTLSMTGQEITCEGLKATAPLIQIDEPGKLTLSTGTYLQYNYNANDSLEKSGGAINISEGGELVISSNSSNLCTICNNASKYGGAILNNGGIVTINGTTFSQNMSAISGGAIYSCNGGQIEINASPISLNQAGQSGGAFYIENSSFSYDGNGVKNILN
ncbi:MAG: hypothetical protein K5866_00155, partial [Treponema sp.]|nr:hypothetical protein [Treponema sp.]